MKKILLLLIASISLLQNCNSVRKTTAISKINRENVTIKTLGSQDFDNNSLLKKNISPLDSFFIHKEKKLYKDVFEKLEFENYIYYSFYISSKQRDEFEEKIIVKFVNKKIERYLLRYARNKNFEVDQSTFKIYLLELKKDNQFTLVPLKKECLRNNIITNEKKSSNQLERYNLYLFSIEEKCDKKFNKKAISFPILNPIETVPLYLVY